MSETKLAVLLMALLLLIAAVPFVLAPSITGFSYFSLGPEQMNMIAASGAKSFITAYVVAIPPKDVAIIAASAVFLIMFGYLMYRLFRRQPSETEQQEPIEAESIEIAEKNPETGEVTADAVLELNKELSVKKTESKRTDYPSLYANELENIQREIDGLQSA